METIVHGCVSVVLPEKVPLPARAGKLSKKEVSRLKRPLTHMGSVCRSSAETLQKLPPLFTLPKELSPELLLEAGERSLEIAKVMHDLFVVMQRLSQAKLLLDHQTVDKLSYLKDIVKLWAKYNPELLIVFAPLLEMFGKSAKTRKERQRKKALKEEKKEATVISLVPKEPSESVA